MNWYSMIVSGGDTCQITHVSFVPFISFGCLFLDIVMCILVYYRGSLPLALHEEAFSCLLCSIGQLGGGLPCSADPRVWLLDEVVTNLKERKSVVQVSKSHFDE